MNLRIRDLPPQPEGGEYFFRRAGCHRDRGPFSLEGLKDLAEFDHIVPEDRVRLDNGPYHRLADLPELMASLFPEKETYRFKTYEKTDDKEAAYPAVEARSLIRCDNIEDAVDEFPVEIEGRQETRALFERLEPNDHPASKAPDPERIDVKEILRENLELQHLREEATADATQSNGLSFLPGFSAVARWVIGLSLMGFALWNLIGGALGIELIPILLISAVVFAIGFAFVVGDVIDGTLSLVEPLFRSPPPPSANWNSAQKLLDAGNAKEALSAVKESLYHHPTNLQGYVIGLRAAARCGNQKEIRHLHMQAKKKLGAHDRNLLAGTIKRLRL